MIKYPKKNVTKTDKLVEDFLLKEYLRLLENPNNVGYDPEKDIWYSPQKGMGYDTNQIGYGLDKNTNEAVQKYLQKDTNGNTYITNEDMLKARDENIALLRDGLDKNYEYIKKLEKSEPYISTKKEFAAINYGYQHGRSAMRKLLDKDRNPEIYNSYVYGSDDDFINIIYDINRREGYNERVKASKNLEKQLTKAYGGYLTEEILPEKYVMKRRINRRKAAFGVPTSPMEALAQDNIYRDTALSQASQVIDPITAGVNQGLDLAGEVIAASVPAEAWNKISKGKWKGAYGMPQGQIPVEVEGGETAQLPNGEMIGFNGNLHENGGIDVDLPEGTEIYSQRLTKDGETLAERKLKRERTMDRVRRKQNKRSTDNLYNNTVERLQMIADYQEAQDQAYQDGVRNLVNQIYGEDSGVYPQFNAACGGRVKAWAGLDDRDKRYELIFENTQDAIADAHNIQTFDYSKPLSTEYVTEPIPHSGTEATLYDTPTYVPISQFMYVYDENNEDIVPKNHNLKYGIFKNSGISNKSKFNWNNFLSSATLGNLNVLAGNMYQGIAPYLTTLKQREGDMPNVNTFRDYNKDAIKSIKDAMDASARTRDTQLADLELSRRSALNDARNQARSVNTLNALGAAMSDYYNQGTEKVYNAYQDNYNKLLAQLSGLQSNRDLEYMKAEDQRNERDTQDRDAFYRNLAKDNAEIGRAIAQSGKDLNAMRLAVYNSNLINQLSKYGIGIDRNGNLYELPKEEQAYGGRVRRTSRIRKCK